MNLVAAEKLALKLIAEYLVGWNFAFSRHKVVLGVCSHQTKTIKLAKAVTLVNSEDVVLNTILHEIAHALVGPGHKHDSVWKAKALSIGCTGSVTGNIKKDTNEDLVALGVKWLLVDDKGTIYRHWFRKPAEKTFAKMPYCWMPNKKAETYGKLKIIPFGG